MSTSKGWLLLTTVITLITTVLLHPVIITTTGAPRIKFGQRLRVLNNTQSRLPLQRQAKMLSQIPTRNTKSTTMHDSNLLNRNHKSLHYTDTGQEIITKHNNENFRFIQEKYAHGNVPSSPKKQAVHNSKVKPPATNQDYVVFVLHKNRTADLPISFNSHEKPGELNTKKFIKKMNSSEEHLISTQDNPHFHWTPHFHFNQNISFGNHHPFFSNKADTDLNNLHNRFNKDTTFYFTHIGPHRFEYRAMFQHGKPEFQPHNFNPFTKFEEFPKINFPPFSPFTEFPEFFEHKPQFPALPHFPPFNLFTTARPEIKRVLNLPEDKPNYVTNNVIDNHFDDPFKQYDVVLGDISTKYPKIFRFNEERINIEDFDKEKKLKMKNLRFSNEIAPPENVQRNQLLILHGGIFTVQEPPLYNRNSIRKRKDRVNDIYRISKHKSRQRNL